MARRKPIEEPMEMPLEEPQMALEGFDTTHDAELTTESDIRGTSTLNNVTKNDIDRAFKTLLDYKEEKASLTQKLLENEDFWKMNHWDVVNKNKSNTEDNRVKPRSAWLFNLILNKHADAMDNYPEANILPRARDDEETAHILSQVIPVILEQNDYEGTYSDAMWYKCKNGTSVQAVLWNDEKNGIGDIEIKKVDLINLYWKQGVSDIEDSPNVFLVEMVDNDELKERYPELDVGGSNLGLTGKESYNVGDKDTDKSAVIDWYYKKRVIITDDLGLKKPQTFLHYCKFCNGQIIYASENDSKYSERGWYDHAKYPFVFDILYPIESSITGIGFIDMEKDDQIYIDKLQQAILESAIVNARPRYFFRTDGQVNEEEFLDLSNPIIHVDGSIAGDNIVPVANSNFNAVYESIFLNKIEELKDTSGNTASSQGQVSSVTSASGIASLTESAGKLSRDSNKASYRAYKKVVELVIELIRQFYDVPRCFRITGDDGQTDYLIFDNSGLTPQEQGMVMGVDLGSRLPIMDIDVKPQKKNAYSKESQNQTALNLYNMGFFAPNNADSSLACLNMMDFDQIEKVKDQIQQNGTLFEQVQMLMQQNMQLMAMLQGATPEEAQMMSQQPMPQQQQMGGASINDSKGSLSAQASNVARNSASPM